MENPSPPAHELLWYKDAIIYELHIKAFCDGNADGIGDFQGLLEKLDYLQELGITAIWVLPFYPSPLRDDGYDIADYYHINPAYGNIQQFKQLLKEAHKRNLKVIIELVVNHTSDQHPWFQRARKAPKNSPERNYYVWTDDPSQYKDVRIIFQDFEPSNWSWDPVAEQYYWHRFFFHQPDLNYDNPQVQEEILRIIDHWCKMGVDGFRLDAIPYLFEREGTNGENLPETHAFLKRLRKHVDEKYPGTVLLAEANMWPEDAAAYFGDGDECHMNYHFPVMPRIFMALQMEDRYPITDIFDQTPAIPDICQWAIFLRNHDELTLEMVTDEERDYMYKVYAKDPKARLNLGIRHRLAPLVENNRRKIELLNCLLFSLPGTPVIYYGDEIGMGDNFYLGDRDGVRTPMQWSPDKNAGFSDANPQKLYLPLLLDPEYHYESVNVETQRGNPSSLFWFMKRIIFMRKKFKALGRGDLKFLNVENPKVLAFTRTYQEENLLVVANLSKFPQAAEVDLSAFTGYVPVETSSRNRFPPIKENGPYFFTLGPHSFYWFSLEKVSQELSEQQLIRLNDLEDLFQAQPKDQFENNILPEYLGKVNWFDGRASDIYNTNIVNHASLPLPERVIWLLVEVSYKSGLPGTYQLPVTFTDEQTAGRLMKETPHAVIAQLQIGEKKGALCDAFFTQSFQLELFNKMMGHQSMPLKSGKIDFYGSYDMKKHWNVQEEIKSRIHPSDQYNTSITYDNRFFLRMYRKVDPSINPDLEITRFLSEDAKFEHMPAFIGAIEWKSNGDAIVLGIMQVMVENHGDGYSFVIDLMNDFTEKILATKAENLNPDERLGSLIDPLPFDKLPEQLQVLLGAPAAEQLHLLGVRTGQMHLALASGTSLPDFRPENFSLYYQRSLFSTMQSLVRETYQTLGRNLKKFSDDMKQQLATIVGRKTEILAILKKIYSKKLDVIKIRIHGNYQLAQVLLTGKDFAIQDYGGDASQTYSERRLRRSPLRDVASMVMSIHYVAHEGVLKNNHIPKENTLGLLPYAALWAHYMSGFFTRGWVDTVQGTTLVPKQKEDLDMMMQVYLLQQALRNLNYEMNYHPDWIIIPLGIIKSFLGPEQPGRSR